MAQPDPASALAIRNAYQKGIQAVSKVLGSIEATSDEKDQAEETLGDLTTAMLAQDIATVQGRTALLAGLIVDLNAVIDRIQIRPPLLPVLTELKGVVDTAKSLLSEEKKNLIS